MLPLLQRYSCSQQKPMYDANPYDWTFLGARLVGPNHKPKATWPAHASRFGAHIAKRRSKSENDVDAWIQNFNFVDFY